MKFNRCAYRVFYVFFALAYMLVSCVASSKDEFQNMPLLYQLSCHVFDYNGEKTVLSGDITLLNVNSHPTREMLVTLQDSSGQVQVVDSKVKLSEDGRFSVVVSSSDSESLRNDGITYDFDWGSDSYVVVSRASCLNCVAIRYKITGTGICDIRQVSSMIEGAH